MEAATTEKLLLTGSEMTYGGMALVTSKVAFPVGEWAALRAKRYALAAARRGCRGKRSGSEAKYHRGGSGENA